MQECTDHDQEYQEEWARREGRLNDGQHARAEELEGANRVYQSQPLDRHKHRDKVPLQAIAI